MADFRGMEVPEGTLIEVNIPTEPFGVWGVNEDFYGLAFCGKITGAVMGCFHAEVTAAGFYGAYDQPDNEVKGKPVRIVIDPAKVQYAEWYGDVLRITLGK